LEQHRLWVEAGLLQHARAEGVEDDVDVGEKGEHEG